MKPSDHWLLTGSYNAPATLDNWDVFTEFVDSQAALHVDKSKRYRLKLASEEIFSNILKYSRPISTSRSLDFVTLDLTAYVCDEFCNENRSPAFVLVVEDDGIAFDPNFDSPKSLDLGAPIEDLPIGGLGLFLVKQSLDYVSYQRVDCLNRYVMTMLNSAAPASTVAPSYGP